MATEEMIMATGKEMKRLGIVQKIIEKVIKQVKGAELLEMSVRQVQRLVRRVRECGEKGIVHRLRCRESNRRIDEGKKAKIIRIYRRNYKGFGPTLAAEKLEEREGIKISDETLRLWLIGVGEWERKRGSREHREWRERKSYYGEMVQMDGSHHDWFEGRGPRCVMMGYIDDATGKVCGKFHEYEGTIPAMDSLKRYILLNGIPQSVYLDRHATYKSNGKPTIEEELEGKPKMSEFERACEELYIRVIHAHSPQAKGRIERLFNTFQDRLVKEMRLEGIKNIDQGNEFLEKYLPVYNRRFSVPAKEITDLHRAAPDRKKLDRILCLKDKRVLRNDWTILYEKKLYQIKDRIHAERVQIEESLEGQIRIYDGDKKLRHRRIERMPKRKPIRLSDLPFRVKKKKSRKPSANHPWREFSFGSRKRLKEKQAA